MAINIAASSFVCTTEVLGVYNLNIVAEPFVVVIEANQVAVTRWPPAEPNPALNQTLYFSKSSIEQYSTIVLSLDGKWLNYNTTVDPFVVEVSIPTTVDGNFVEGFTIYPEAFVVSLGFAEPIAYTERPRRNWVKWSNIGSLDFTVWKDNIAGERPMDWRGWVYDVRKLVSRVVVYGEGGVSFLIPVGNAWGLQTIYKPGLKSKCAVTGTDAVHWFVDSQGCLCRLSDRVEQLGYEEFLSSMNNIVMSYDTANNLVYICDGISGFVFNSKENSLGQGPENITGIGYTGSSLYYVSAGEIVIPEFNICTDTYDFGTRNPKTINNIVLGIDATTELYAAIDYRGYKDQAFSTSAWRSVGADGRAWVSAYGVEFRIRVKAVNREIFELDYIQVNGMIHS